MNMQQHALLIRTNGNVTRGLDELNVRLGRGWRVVHTAPMGGASLEPADPEAGGLCLAALVVIERAEETVADVMQQAEEETEELVEEIVEGNGSNLPPEGLGEERNGGKM